MSASKAGAALLALASAVVISNAYGQIGLGVFALLRVGPAVFMVLTDPGFSHAVPFLRGNRKVSEHVLVGSGIKVYGFIATLQMLLWALLTPWIQHHLFPPLPITAVYVASLLAPMQSILIYMVNLLRARLHYDLANSIFLIVELVLSLSAAFASIWFDPDPAILVFLLVLSLGVALVFGITCIVRTGKIGTLQPDNAVVIEGVRFGIRSQIGNAFQILNYRLDHLLLGIFLIPEKVAVYFVATKSIEFFRFFTASVVFVFEPIIAAQGRTDAKARVRKMLVPLSVANLLLLLIGVILAPFFYPIIFGDWSSEATKPLVILSIGLAISGANSLFAAYFLGQGNPGLTTLASLGGLVVTIVLGVILIPSYDIIGAAVTSSTAYAAITLFYLVVFFGYPDLVEANEK